MIKMHSIDLERVNGIALFSNAIEVQAVLDVKLDPEPLDGVSTSTLRMSLDNAHRLLSMLTTGLKDAQRRGWKPTVT